MLLGDVVDQFHNDDSLADASATEQSDLATFQEGWIRSMTFTPVSNISAVVACSSNSGAGR